MKYLSAAFFLLVISCENQDVDKNNGANFIDNISDIQIFKTTNGKTKHEDSYEISDISEASFSLVILSNDSNLIVLDNEMLVNNNFEINWVLTGTSNYQSSSSSFLKDLEIGEYVLTVGIEQANTILTDQITLKISTLPKVVENGFLKLSYISSYPQNIFVDDNDIVWIPSYFLADDNAVGMLNYNETNFSKFYSNKINSPKNVFVDKDGKYWFNDDYKKEISYLKDDKLNSIPINDGIHINISSSNFILEDRVDSDYLYILMLYGNIFRMNRFTYEYTFIAKGPGKSLALTYDHLGNVWASKNGADTFKSSNWVDWTHVPEAPGAQDIAVYGETVYFATSNGLITYKDSTWTTYSSSNTNLPTHYLSAIAVNNDGLVHIGTGNHGVLSFANSVFTSIANTDDAVEITAIDFDSNNKIYFAHSKGVVLEQ